LKNIAKEFSIPLMVETEDVDGLSVAIKGGPPLLS
jgi:hypothetical protein